jgi:hypothetical protein
MDKPVSDNRRMDIPRKAKEECPKSGSVTRWRGRRIHFSGWLRTTICTRSTGLAPAGARLNLICLPGKRVDFQNGGIYP